MTVSDAAPIAASAESSPAVQLGGPPSGAGTSTADSGDIQPANPAIFYKTPHLSGATWDNALTYQLNGFYAYLSQHLQSWTLASSKIFDSPFGWISSGSTSSAPRCAWS